MGFWTTLLKATGVSVADGPVKAESRNTVIGGFHWGGAGVTACAAGKGFSQAVVGESFYSDALERIAGGPTVQGVNATCTAELRQGCWQGHSTIEVWIDSLRCGSISKTDLPSLLKELSPLLAQGRPVTARASISAGYEGGDYCVKLSLARPLRVRNS